MGQRTTPDQASTDDRDQRPSTTTATGARLVTSLDEVDALLHEHPDLLVRYSLGPEHDRNEQSIDYESGLQLPGLSCNPLRVESWWARPRLDWIARKLCNYAHLQREHPERCGWLLAGHVVAYGPDNEPIVDDWREIAILDPEVLDAAERRYGERFDVGNDST